MNPKGVVISASQWSVTETIDRLQEFLIQHGATIYARINQQKEVNNTGQHILPLEFILFGNPRAGGFIMAENPLAALDLPLKVIAWEDAEKKVWVAFNDAAYIEERYALSHIPNSPLNIENVVSAALKK